MEELGLAQPQAKEPEMQDNAAINYGYVDPLHLSEDDLYVKLKSLKKQIEFIQIQENYIKDEQKNLKKEYRHAQEEVKRIKSVPLVIGQFLEAVDQNTGILGSTTGSNYYVRILSTIDRELLKAGASVALHKHSNALVDVLPPEADSSIAMLQAGNFILVALIRQPIYSSHYIVGGNISQ
ncbi:Proteasome 26S subunit ATPase 4 [Fasciola hepatica]|uniref:Proteasome 26S subunit ATPase 4 n=1 Tax=Fasciola hepatica TaxID=6192 RepID=A0A2H1BSM2_FASHE|nr:Proteasome 26S subunit ATPase 4 [Fasciola hepatica]